MRQRRGGERLRYTPSGPAPGGPKIIPPGSDCPCGRYQDGDHAPGCVNGRTNGGVPCDTEDGACACGAWHKKTFVTKDSGKREQYDSGMVRDTQDGKPRYDLIPHIPLRRLADLYARGAEKYGEGNWMKAAGPEEMQRFKASAFRHFMQALQGERDEDHYTAAVWNLFAIMWLEDKLQ